jgi:hypothetical protein
MTVTVTLRDGATDSYLRYGDEYVKHDDGTLDVVRAGVDRLRSYAPDLWTDVKGDEKRLTRSRFGRWLKGEATQS